MGSEMCIRDRIAPTTAPATATSTPKVATALTARPTPPAASSRSLDNSFDEASVLALLEEWKHAISDSEPKAPPDIESTQTVRPLTPLELASDDTSRWFVIQLSLSEQPVDPETLPALDIFGVYRLYCVAGLDQGRVLHALRLGFFSEQTAAGAVAGYLSTYYANPLVKRVSAAERERFAEQLIEARKDVGATGQHAVIEITSERVARHSRSSV